MQVFTALLVSCFIFCAAVALPTTSPELKETQIEDNDDIQQILQFDDGLEKKVDGDLQVPMMFEYKVVNDLADSGQNLDLMKNSTTSTEQINGTIVIKNETRITQKTEMGQINWHLIVTETRNTQNLSMKQPELKINLMPEIQRDTEGLDSPEDAENQQFNEFFDDIDGLENFDNHLYQHQDEMVTNFEPFDYVYNPSEEYYANHNNDQQSFNVNENFPVDLSNDIAVNQKLFDQGAEFHPDAEIFSLDDFSAAHHHQQRPILQHSDDIGDIK